MSLELVSIETGTYPLDGVFYRPEGGTGKDAILIMHGNCGNFYTGVPRHVAPLLVQLGYAVLAFNRRGHDILATTTRECVGGAYQRIHEMVEDNQHAERWLATQGFERPIVIGHSNGGMLAVKHCAGSASVRALVLLSAHMGGKNLFRTISEAGLMAGKRFDEFSARTRVLVAAGAGSELMQVPGWWWIISAQTFVDYLDVCPDILELAPQVRCCSCAAIARRSMSMPATGDPAEFALVSDCDPFYGGREQAAVELIADWLARSNIKR